MSRQTDIVVTTIFEPKWLQGYLDNLRRFGHDHSTTIHIICDRKTPTTVFAAAEAARAQGFQINCPSLDEQDTYLQKLGFGTDFIPWDTDNRRNIGFLRALESGTDLLISIDDDNYCIDDVDFVGSHQVVGTPVAELSAAKVASDGDWFNICDLLQFNTPATVFARGFPYSERNDRQPPALRAIDSSDTRTVAINAGLWLDDPDVDAISRLAVAPWGTAASAEAVVLSAQAWSPINTQNTALHRDAIAAYYYVRMGYPLDGLRIDRFGDILSGYFVQKVAKHLGYAIRLGSPVARHLRTPHNLFKDLHHELAGIVLLEELLPWMRELKLSGRQFSDSYAELADAMRSQSAQFSGFIWDQGGRDFLTETADCMHAWLSVIARLEGGNTIPG